MVWFIFWVKDQTFDSEEKVVVIPSIMGAESWVGCECYLFGAIWAAWFMRTVAPSEFSKKKKKTNLKATTRNVCFLFLENSKIWNLVKSGLRDNHFSVAAPKFDLPLDLTGPNHTQELTKVKGLFSFLGVEKVYPLKRNALESWCFGWRHLDGNIFYYSGS